MKKTELAWAAGFLDGDGHIGTTRWNTKKGTYGSVRIQASQIRRDVLDRLSYVLGGRVCGPYENGPNASPVYKYSLQGIDVVKEKYLLLEPYLSAYRKEQWEEALRKTGELEYERTKQS